jgi:hypothetical protein
MKRQPCKTFQLTREQRARHRAIREAFREWHPGPDELIASRAATPLGLNVIHFPAQELIRQLKASHEAAGLTLPTCQPAAASTSRPCPAWKTATRRIRPLTRFGVTPRRRGNGWCCPPKTFPTLGRGRQAPAVASRKKPRCGRRCRREVDLAPTPGWPAFNVYSQLSVVRREFRQQVGGR